MLLSWPCVVPPKLLPCSNRRPPLLQSRPPLLCWLPWLQVGLDFSTLVEGLLASSGWDEMTYVWNMNQAAV